MIQKIRPQDVLRRDASVFGLLREAAEINPKIESEIDYRAGCIANSSAASRYSPELLDQKLENLYQHYMSERGLTYYPTGKEDFGIQLLFWDACTNLRDANSMISEPYFLIIKGYQFYDLIQRMLNVLKKPVDDRLEDQANYSFLVRT